MKWNLWTVLSIRMRIEYNGNIFALCWSIKDGFEIVQLDADTDRPYVLDVIYAGRDKHEAARVVKALGG